jgi:hypothetical protein
MNRTRSHAKKAKSAKSAARKKAVKPKKVLHASKSQHSTGGPLPDPGHGVSKYSAQIGLPPNEKLRKFADEIYGEMELPHRKHDSK